MPVITRATRACSLALAGSGLVVASVLAPGAVAQPARAEPPKAAPSHADARPGVGQAVVLSSAELAKERERAKKRRKREAKRRAEARRRLNRRVLSARNIAMAQRGDPYSYGASGPNAFDCSGLVYYSYRRAGFAVPRTSGAQAAHSRRISRKAMAPGDLMFFYGGSGVYHVAVFLRWERGRAVMVHAPSSGRRVEVSSPWTSSWFGGTLRR